MKAPVKATKRNSLAAMVLAALAITGPSASAAECPDMISDLRLSLHSLDFFVEQKNAHEKRLQAVLNTCKQTASAVGTVLAYNAKGGACQALEEAAEMDRQLEEIGAECRGNVEDLENSLAGLRFVMDDYREGMAAALDFLKNPLFNKTCSKEMAYFRKVQRGFEGHDKALAGTADEMASGRKDLENFEVSLAQLRVQAKASADGCGRMASLNSPHANPAPAEQVANGMPRQNAELPKGQSPRNGSTITGEIEPEGLRQGATRTLAAWKAPAEEAFQNGGSNISGKGVAEGAVAAREPAAEKALVSGGVAARTPGGETESLQTLGALKPAPIESTVQPQAQTVAARMQNAAESVQATEPRAEVLAPAVVRAIAPSVAEGLSAAPAPTLSLQGANSEEARIAQVLSEPVAADEPRIQEHESTETPEVFRAVRSCYRRSQHFRGGSSQ